MRPSFYYDGHYLSVADKIRSQLNDTADFLSLQTAHSTRATGDAIQDIVAEKFDTFLNDWCREYSSDFARRAMADIAFTDKEGVYSIVDVKTHRESTHFNMPNLTSVERLARFYESDTNVFSLLMVRYRIEGSHITVSEVTFAPIEFLNWNCLTIGALGWGQIQIANSNRINLRHSYSRKEWMLELCEHILQYYPREISKIETRIGRFESVRNYWEQKDDVWS